MLDEPGVKRDDNNTSSSQHIPLIISDYCLRSVQSVNVNASNTIHLCLLSLPQRPFLFGDFNISEIWKVDSGPKNY